MKRFTLILVAIMLIAAMMITPVFATSEGSPSAALSQSTLTGQPGEIVSTTLNLAGSGKVNAIFFQVSSGEGLKLESGTAWQIAGSLSDIDLGNSSGVWSVTSSTEVNGAIATLVFKVPTPAAGQTDVDYNFTCSVVVEHEDGSRSSLSTSGIVRANVPATGLTLDKSSASLELVGSPSCTLTATVSPANTTDQVSWTTSDASVATVSGGTVTALKPGTAVITATAGSQSASCQITVTCNHNLTTHTANPATCTATGNNLYYTCNACRAVLDANKNATTVEAQTLPMLSHNYSDTYTTDENNHWRKCQDCSATTDLGAHSFTWITDVEATATTEGKKHEECTVCHYKRNENTVIPHTHSVTHHPAVSATCKTEGNVEYWTCASSLCTGKNYNSAVCTATIENVVLAIDPANHTGGTETKNYQAETCGADGYSGDTYCKGCNTLTQSGRVLPATGNHAGGTATCTAQAVCSTCTKPYGNLKDHSYSSQWTYDDSQHWRICTSCNTAKTGVASHTLNWVTDTPATEDVEGKQHQECSCGYQTSLNTTIDKLPHVHVSITHHPAVAATCTTTGNVEYWTCGSSKCSGKYYDDDTCGTALTTIVVPINEDNHTATEVRNLYAANCYQTGYTGDTHCKNCGDLLESGTVINATGNHVAGTEWHTTTTKHWHLCTTTDCGTKVGEADHTFKWVVDKEATEDETGLKHEECECGVKRNENQEIPKLDHVHIGIKHYAAVPATCVKAGTLEYWTCASNKCTGKYYGDAKCQLEITSIEEAVNPDNHAGPNEVKDKVEATCVDEGYSGDTYCTSCKEMAKKGEVVPATGKHTPEKGYKTDDKYHWQLCSHCEAVIGGKKEGHVYTWKVDKKATETATGLKHQECTVCGDKANEKTTIEKLKHVPSRVDGKLATCTEDGVLLHYYCANCGRYYADEDGKVGKQIQKEDTVLTAAGHTFGTEWVSDEKNHWHTCACGEIADKEAHKLELVGVLEATEIEEGYTGDEVCAVCEQVLTEGQAIPCLSSVETTEPATEEDAPAESQVQNKKPAITGLSILWIVLLLAAAVLIIVLIVMKRKEKNEQ